MPKDVLMEYTIDLGVKVLDIYKLPPMLLIAECDIRWLLSMAHSKEHRKYICAQIILGQPFNYRAGEVVSRMWTKVD